MKKIFGDANYIEEREKKSIHSVSTLYTSELSYSLAFSALLQASRGLMRLFVCVVAKVHFSNTDGV